MHLPWIYIPWRMQAYERYAMNKQIKYFERQSNIDVYGLGLDRVKWETTLKKFTELIVQECIDHALHSGDDIAYLNKHFGVEE